MMRTVLASWFLWTISSLALSADEPYSVQQLADVFEATIECVLDRHVEPPTRQQMVLSLLQRLHSQDSPTRFAELSRTVSDAENRASLYKLMRDELELYGSTIQWNANRLESLDVSWLARTVPGGVELQSAKNADVQNQLAANRYVGIGVQLIKKNNDFVFSGILENGTAERAGILAQDRLLEIEGEPVTGELVEVVERLRGPEGSTFRVTIQTDQEKPREVELRRLVVVMKTMKLEPIMPGASTANIIVRNITASSVHELESLIDQLPDSVDRVALTIQFDGNFHYFHLFADALLDEFVLGEMVMREGKRTIRTMPGNVLAGRKLNIWLNDRSEQQKLLLCLARCSQVQVLRQNNSYSQEQLNALANSLSSLNVRQTVPPVAKPKLQRDTNTNDDDNDNANDNENQQNSTEMDRFERVYLKELCPILDGKALVSLATRKFQ